MQTRVLTFNDEAIAEAARLILAGEPVAMPTETVYGLAADATNAEAVARIYAAKGRPSFNPLIVHVPDLAVRRTHRQVFGRSARHWPEIHWPGPLTLVVPLRGDAGIASIVTAGLPTIAIRVPQHPAMQALLREVGRPLAAPSANASGSISPTRAEHVMKSLGGRIPLIIDGRPYRTGFRIDDRRCDGWRTALASPGPIQIDAKVASGDENRGARTASEPLRAVEAASAQCHDCRS